MCGYNKNEKADYTWFAPHSFKLRNSRRLWKGTGGYFFFMFMATVTHSVATPIITAQNWNNSEYVTYIGIALLSFVWRVGLRFAPVVAKQAPPGLSNPPKKRVSRPALWFPMCEVYHNLLNQTTINRQNPLRLL